MTFYQRRAITRLAVQAANDEEYGYDGASVIPSLLEIDSLYDWAPLVWQIELEEGYREMGPHPRVQGFVGGVATLDRLLASYYEDYVVELCRNPLFTHLSNS